MSLYTQNENWDWDRWGRYQYRTGYEDTGVCWWCGGDFPDRRPRRFCSEDCRLRYYAQFSWTQAVELALKEAGNKCQECGGSYRLEVHHIEPLKGEYRALSDKNRSENLVVLCHDCHWKRHRGKVKVKDKDSWESAIAMGQGILDLFGEMMSSDKPD